jgi:hypothetical protein
MRHVAAISLVILYYDYLLTLDDEVRLIFLYFPRLTHLIVRRFALFGQGLRPCQNGCFTLIAIYHFSLLFIQTTVST